MFFTDADKLVLETFVTSAMDPIYAIKHTLPPEVFGAFGSYFSRNPEDFRVHLLNAIKGTLEESTLNDESSGYYRLLKHDYWNPNEAITGGLQKAQDFYSKWYGKYSHKSIANTVWIPLVATNVSQLFAKELAYEQLAFFIEQSTRYVKWDVSKMYQDPEIMAGKHRELYLKTLGIMVSGYEQLIDEAIKYYERVNPFPLWLEKQIEKTQKESELVQRATYDRQIRGAALDIARFLLPQATMTNIAWVVDARSLEYDIAAWKGHPLTELRNSAALIGKSAGQIAPSLLKYTEKNEYYAGQLMMMYQVGERISRGNSEIQKTARNGFTKGVDIISFDPDALNKTIANLLKRHSVGGTFAQRYAQVAKMSFPEKMQVLETVTANRDLHDEWVCMDEEFDLVQVTAEIRSDLGAVRDWRRHQKWNRSEALYTTDNGIHRPEVLKQMSKQAEKIFDQAIEAARKAELAIMKNLPFAAQYIVPMATMQALTMSGGLDQAQYLLWTRSTPQGNFSYREDAFNFAEALVEVHPWLLGYEKYPEMMTFMEIYRNAPLKSLLRLQIGETALHQ